MITVANPIYDVVFKYLMEDTRIARTILSALLKKDITDVKIRPHEYTNDKRDSLSVFHIDFAATVREDDGCEHLILIELQKTWLPTETLRFRQYLGVQYENPRNMVGGKENPHALPMVAVYILGHKVGDIEEPVIYVRHEALDYDGNPVTKGIPNVFVDSLTHDSIIVQIPRLHGQINNRLDEVLSVFDQTRQAVGNQQMLRLADDLYPDDDAEMQRIVRRLLMAAADADMRMDMNVEDEYFSIIEDQDTDIMLKTRQIAEQTVKLKQQSEQLSQQSEQISQQSEQISQQSEQLSQQSEQLNQKNALLRSSIQMLLESGVSLESIAANWSMTEEEVRELIQQPLA